MKVLFAALVVLLCAAIATAEVVKLTSSNYDSVVGDENKNVFVKYFAPWCGHCVRMQPAWEQLSKESFDGQDVVIAEVDVTANEDIADKAGIEGFPTIKLFTKKNRAGQEYHGPRDAAALKKFVNEQLSK